MLHFLHGCYSNYSERFFCKQWKGMPEYNLIAPSLFCSWFGLVQVQVRVSQPINPNEDVSAFDFVTSGDNKDLNFGYYKGRLVCCDYG